MEASKKSIKGFINLFLSLNEPVYMFHQTLTTRLPIADPAEAKAHLKKLLDVLHKRFNLVTMYVEERQVRGAVHYHLFFFIYNGNDLSHSEQRAETILRRAVFAAWNNIHGRTLFQRANKLELHNKGDAALEYFLKEVTLRSGGNGRGRNVNWWGCRNRGLIRANSSPVSAHDVEAKYQQFFSAKLRAQTRETVFAHSSWTVSDLAWLRRERERYGFHDWEIFKQVKAEAAKPLPDWQFANRLTTVQNGVKTDAGLLDAVHLRNPELDDLL